MRRKRRTLRAVLALLACAAVLACPGGPARESDDPCQVALQLFALAAGEAERERLVSLFDPELDSARLVALHEALDQLAGTTPGEVLEVQTAPGVQEAFVDLAAGLPGGGRASYNVKLRRLDGGAWRIAWFQGPGVEWPPRRRRGVGLSTSAPPDPRADGW